MVTKRKPLNRGRELDGNKRSKGLVKASSLEVGTVVAQPKLVGFFRLIERRPDGFLAQRIGGLGRPVLILNDTEVKVLGNFKPKSMNPKGKAEAKS